MKKVILVLAVVLGFSFANAQANFGVKGGVNLANLHGDVENNDMVVKLHFGAYANFPISEKFQIQPELLYQGYGSKTEYSFSDPDVSYSGEETIKMDYLTIPIMAKYFFTEGFYGEFGPQFGFALSQKLDFEESGTFFGESYSEDGSVDLDSDEAYGDAVKGFDIALGFGIGYQLESGLNFGARYNLGLNSVLESNGFKAKNGAIMIGLGYTFGLN